MGTGKAEHGYRERKTRDMTVNSYKDLDVWNKGIEIVDHVYEVTSQFPKEETYGLAAHMRKKRQYPYHRILQKAMHDNIPESISSSAIPR